MPETPTSAAREPGTEPRGTKRVRIDLGSARGTDLAPGRGSVLRAFGAWGRQPARVEDRRAEVRHDQVECQAWVGWRTWRRFQMNNALLVNLSRGGAQIFLDAAPPPGRALWVFLETPDRKTIVKARALEVVKTAGGQCTVRVAFHEPCPFSFFEAAVCGLAAVNPRMRAAANRRATAGMVDG